MAISFRAATFGGVGPSTTLTINKPTGTVSGDVLVAWIYVDLTNTVSTPPSGWTQVDTVHEATSSYNAYSYVHVCGGSEPASYSWTLSGNVYTEGVIAGFVGVNNTTPVDVHGIADRGSTQSPVTPSVTTTGAGDALVAMLGVWNGNGGASAQNSYVLPTNGQPSGGDFWLEYLLGAAQGAVGGNTFSCTAGASGAVSAIIALKPAGTTSSRTITSATAALRKTNTRTIASITAAVGNYVTHSIVGNSAALRGTPTRTVTATGNILPNINPVVIATADQQSQTRMGRPIVRDQSGNAIISITPTYLDATNFGPAAYAYSSPSPYSTWTQRNTLGTGLTGLKLGEQDTSNNGVSNPSLYFDPVNNDILGYGQNNQNDGGANPHAYNDITVAYTTAYNGTWTTSNQTSTQWDNCAFTSATIIPATHNIWFVTDVMTPGSVYGNTITAHNIVFSALTGETTATWVNNGGGNAGSNTNGPVAPANTTVPMFPQVTYTAGSPATLYCFFNDTAGVLRYCTWADAATPTLPSGLNTASTGFASPISTGTLGVTNEQFSVARDSSDGLHVVVKNASGIQYVYKPLGGAWTAATTISAAANDIYPRVTCFGSTGVVVTWVQATGTTHKQNIVYSHATIGTSPTFSAPVTIFNDSSTNNASYVNAEANSQDGTSFMVVWVQGTASPYSVYAAQVTPTFKTTSTRTLSGNSTVLQGTFKRTVTSVTGALSGTFKRTIAGNSATISSTLVRSITGDSAALRSTLTRSITPTTAALRRTSSRTVGATAALRGTNTRSVPPSAALRSTLVRTATPVRAALQSTFTHTITPVTTPLRSTLSHIISPTIVSLQSTMARALTGNSAALRGTLKRSLTVTAALSGGFARNITPATAALKQLNLARSTPATVALLRTLARTATPNSAALRSTLTRSLSGNKAVLLHTSSRTITPATAALSGTFKRVIGSVSTNLSGSGLSRTITGVSVRLSGTPHRTVAGVSAALRGTSTRSVTPATVTLRSTLARTLTPATVALKSTGLTHTLSPVTATISTLAHSRTINSVSSALRSTLGRSIAPNSVVLKSTLHRTVTTVTARLVNNPPRSVPAVVVLFGTPSRTIAATVALSGGRARTVSATARLIATSQRSIATTIALHGTVTHTVPGAAALTQLNIARPIVNVTATVVPANRPVIVADETAIFTVPAQTAVLRTPGQTAHFTITG